MVGDELVLTVRDLVVETDMGGAPVRLVDGVSFDVRRNEVLCLVGESGSGKSVTMSAVLGLLPPNLRITSGEIVFNGLDMRRASPKELRSVRGRDIAVIFQDPMTSLNPVMRVGRQLAEMLTLHRKGLSRTDVSERVQQLLTQVGITNPAASHAYPHEFSGGMRQRAMIAMAATHSPDLLIADEPTTALDVTVQAQVLRHLRAMRESSRSAMVLVTHDLGVVAENADRVAVMYSGRVVETGDVHAIFNRPSHPYTVGLLGSLLDMESDIETAYAVPGQPPLPHARPTGCSFSTRCALADDDARCREEAPPLEAAEPAHEAACWRMGETAQWVELEFPTLSAGAR